MKALLADLPILAKFLLLPAIAALLMVLLGGLYVVEQRDTVALQERISGQDVPRLNELSRLFSQFSTNHVQFINLLAVSLRGATGEAQFYRAGRERILAVNRTIEELRVASERLAHDDPTRALSQQLWRRLAEYRDQMGEAVLLSSVSLRSDRAGDAGGQPGLRRRQRRVPGPGGARAGRSCAAERTAAACGCRPRACASSSRCRSPSR